MNTQQRYQYGSLTRRKRIQKEDIWQFRYYETTPEGRRRRRSVVTGHIVFPSRFEPNFWQSSQIPLGFRSGQV